MDRRSFIKKYSTATLAGLCCSSLLMGCQSTPKIKHNLLRTGRNNKITVNKSILNTDNFAILQADTLKFPVFLHKQDNQYTALLMSCTHQKCTLSVAEDKLICPCHGAKFNKSGTVLKGPAEKDLLVLQLNESEDEVTIQLP